MRAEAYVTAFELTAHGPNFLLARVREKVRDELFDAIVRDHLNVAEIDGGRRYWMDVLVLTPATLLQLVEDEARRLVRNAGYGEVR